MDYKTVFQLAQSKGFVMPYDKGQKDFDFIISLYLQKWLRDTHKIHVSLPHGNSEKYGWRVYEKKYHRSIEQSKRFSYEEALLEGITQALQLI